MNHPQRFVFVLFACALLMSAVVGIFWYQDWQYALPTPKPRALVQAPVGSHVAWPAPIARVVATAGHRPILLHFFNPVCPCSRFNLGHLRTLRDKFGARARFVAVVQGDDSRSALDAFQRTHLNIEAIPDVGGAIAHACGVYSTPQAVVLDSSGALYYRGNYNVARYCESTATQFARIALEAAVKGESPPRFPSAATIAYGCRLPADKAGRN